MSDLDSGDYYRRRERQECASAAAAIDRHVGAIHREMAERYAELIQQVDPAPLPRMKLLVRA